MVRHVRVTKWVSSFYHFLISWKTLWGVVLMLTMPDLERWKSRKYKKYCFLANCLSFLCNKCNFPSLPLSPTILFTTHPHTFMIFSYFLWSYVLCVTGWRWALTRGIERVFPHLSVSNMILCLAAVYITLVTCWCILSGFLCRLMQRNVLKQRFCLWNKYLEPDPVDSANILSIFWPLFVLLDSFEKNK